MPVAYGSLPTPPAGLYALAVFNIVQRLTIACQHTARRQREGGAKAHRHIAVVSVLNVLEADPRITAACLARRQSCVPSAIPGAPSAGCGCGTPREAHALLYVSSVETVPLSACLHRHSYSAAPLGGKSSFRPGSTTEARDQGDSRPTRRVAGRDPRDHPLALAQLAVSFRRRASLPRCCCAVHPRVRQAPLATRGSRPGGRAGSVAQSSAFTAAGHGPTAPELKCI